MERQYDVTVELQVGLSQVSNRHLITFQKGSISTFASFERNNLELTRQLSVHLTISIKK
jgi:hypothetical protein